MSKNKDVKRMRFLAKVMFLYPPFIGAGISVKSVNEDATEYVIQLKKRWYNRNAYGTHFGGSLYAMVDPFFVFCAASYFGNTDYILWDKSASIEYLSPGKTTVTARIGIPHARLKEMKQEVDDKGKGFFDFETEVLGKDGKVVARVKKKIYIRKK